MTEIKKGFISEEDASLLLQRYTATTILAMFQEIAECDGVKIDWNTLVKKTSTGISNAREYQMLWRHLAYRHSWMEKVEDDAEPLDDDSDLEFELEPFPAVSYESSTEAAACVKVLMGSGSPNEIGPTTGSMEAPLTINVPNGQSIRASENSQLPRGSQGMNITVPVSIQKQSMPSEGQDGTGIANSSLPARRKRKPWRPEEDMELIAAVEKCGEGNWANILKGDFKFDRTASQLSQRWGTLKRNKANSHSNNASNSGNTSLTEAQLATRQAVSIALNMPLRGSLSTACPTGTKSGCENFVQAANNPQQQTPNQSTHPRGVPNPTPTSKPRIVTKKSPVTVNPSVGPNPLVQAAAVAAGARIANPSAAASLLKAAQSKNAVHIRPGSGSLVKSTLQLTSSSTTRSSNVHYIRTGLSTQPPLYTNVPSSTPKPNGHQPTLSGSSKSMSQNPQAQPTLDSKASASVPAHLYEDSDMKDVSGPETEANTRLDDEISPSSQVEMSQCQTIDNFSAPQMRPEEPQCSGMVDDTNAEAIDDSMSIEIRDSDNQIFGYCSAKENQNVSAVEPKIDSTSVAPSAQVNEIESSALEELKDGTC